MRADNELEQNALATISFSSFKRAFVRNVIHEKVTTGITLLEVFIKPTYILLGIEVGRPRSRANITPDVACTPPTFALAALIGRISGS